MVCLALGWMQETMQPPCQMSLLFHRGGCFDQKAEKWQIARLIANLRSRVSQSAQSLRSADIRTILALPG